jgi:tryptophanyl-tRNA synthetase
VTNAGQNRRVLSGMRPTGALHLGNYHGALRNWLELQYQYECFFFVADWHALTTGYEETKGLEDKVWQVVIDWLAAGLNPGACTMFVQSRVPEHAELHLLLSMITPLGWLERVPTYKDQIEQLKDKDLSTYGFLGYPLLQSADILLYRAQYVPVGEDQVAHVEITREVARRFNHIFGREEDTEQKVKRALKQLGSRTAAMYQDLRRQYQEAPEPCGSRAPARLRRRHRQGDPGRTAGAAHTDAQAAGARWPQDVEVLWQYDRDARGSRRRGQEAQDHADGPGARAADRPG